MRSGTPFSRLTPFERLGLGIDRLSAGRLVLVQDSGGGTDLWDDAAVDARGPRPSPEDARAAGDIRAAEDIRQVGAALAVLVSVSAACAAASVATGSYALWLSRRRATRRALTDVDDLLRSCQSRMEQMEAELSRQAERPRAE